MRYTYYNNTRVSCVIRETFSVGYTRRHTIVAQRTHSRRSRQRIMSRVPSGEKVTT